ncbi:MAG: hypothetical protein R3D33_00080 [Hyphomicrobiaceae bacterium]
MRDGGEFGVSAVGRLTKEMDEQECRRRNALSRTLPGFRLKVGDVVNIVDTFESGNAFLVEVGDQRTNECRWMGVLTPGEIEMDRTGGRN